MLVEGHRLQAARGGCRDRLRRAARTSRNHRANRRTGNRRAAGQPISRRGTAGNGRGGSASPARRPSRSSMNWRTPIRRAARNQKTLRGRGGFARRRHQRHQHAQHPASRKPLQRGRDRDGRAGQGAHPRRVPHARGPDREHRPAGRGPDRAACRRARSIRRSESSRRSRISSRPAEPDPAAGNGVERGARIFSTAANARRKPTTRSTNPAVWGRWPSR